jgi:hypothetical protein
LPDGPSGRRADASDGGGGAQNQRNGTVSILYRAGLREAPTAQGMHRQSSRQGHEMNEYIAIRFNKNGKRLKVARQRPNGIEFDEPDPIQRSVGIQFTGRDAITRFRMDSIRRIQGWDPGQFKLNLSVEDGFLMLRGVTPQALPEGRYRIVVELEEAKTPGSHMVDVDHDEGGEITVDVQMDDRTVDVDLDDADERILEVLDRSQVDGAPAVDWVADTSHRPTRQACLLNLLASMRIRPTAGSPLIALVHDVFLVANDRIYAKVDRKLVDTLQDLADDPDRPFYAEGKPHAAIHGQLLTEMPEPPETKARFKDLLSFRAEGKPSMQVVIAVPPADLPFTYADFDLDLGNPLQDIAGFFVHMGELLDGRPTNHLDLRKGLAKTAAGGFLYYTVVAA